MNPKFKKIAFISGIVILGVLLLVAENLWIVSACDQMLSEENWLQIPVTISDGNSDKNIGVFTISDKTGDFIYKDNSGTSFYNDWHQISVDVVKAKAVKSSSPKPKSKVTAKITPKK